MRIKHLQAVLNKAMSSMIRSERQLIPQIQKELATAYNDEETYWKQKSRNQWMLEGDRNTSFFHARTKTRFSKNRIMSIKDEHGSVFLVIMKLVDTPNISSQTFTLRMDVRCPQ